jgi:hypothetical protein
MRSITIRNRKRARKCKKGKVIPVTGHEGP